MKKKPSQHKRCQDGFFSRVLISYLLKTFWVSFTLKYHYICNDILVLMGVSFKNNLKLGSLSDYLY